MTLHKHLWSDVGSDRCRNTKGFLTKNVKEIFRDLNFLSEVTGCRKTQVSECTGSNVYVKNMNLNVQKYLCHPQILRFVEYSHKISVCEFNVL